MITIKGTMRNDAKGFAFRLDFINEAEPVPQFRSVGYFTSKEEAIKEAEKMVQKRYHPVVKIEWGEWK